MHELNCYICFSWYDIDVRFTWNDTCSFNMSYHSLQRHKLTNELFWMTQYNFNKVFTRSKNLGSISSDTHNFDNQFAYSFQIKTNFYITIFEAFSFNIFISLYELVHKLEILLWSKLNFNWEELVLYLLTLIYFGCDQWLNKCSCSQLVARKTRLIH